MIIKCEVTGAPLKQCPSCSDKGLGPKPVAEFYPNRRARGDGYQSVCKACNREQKREHQRKMRNTWDGKAQALHSNILDRTKDKKWPRTDITPLWISRQMKAQGYKCAVTGLPFELGTHELYSKHPWAPSIDRLDNDVHYTVTNVQIVCHFYNNMKNVYEDNVLRTAVLALSAKYREEGHDGFVED